MVTAVRYTPQKQQELVSRHQFCERLVQFGWVTSAPEDLGEDFVVHIYFEGRATGVIFFVQIKSVANLLQCRRDNYVPYSFEVKDLTHWEQFKLPVVLVVWDVKLRQGCWVLLPDVIQELDQRHPGWRQQKSKTILIPWQNNTDDSGLIRLRQRITVSLFPFITSGQPTTGEKPLINREQFLQEVQRLSRILTAQFDVNAVYLFGSLAWDDHINPHTDIDLAVSGLPPEKYYRAVALLERETDFPFDLVILEDAPEALRQRIVTQGELLYERECTATGV